MLKTTEHLKSAENDLANLDKKIIDLSQELTVYKQQKRRLERDINGYSGPEKPDEIPKKQDETPVILDESTDHIPELDEHEEENID